MTNCLILGGNSDIGIAIAQRFAANSFNIILAVRNISDVTNVAVTKIINTYNVKAKAVYFNGSDFNSHNAFYSNLPYKPDIVVSVFGYLGNNEKSLKDFSEALNIIEGNFTAHASILNIVAADMKKRKSGTIIGISSVAGDRGRQSNFFYGASKAAFNEYLSGLRNSLSDSGVHVITVKPGYVRTKMTAHMQLPSLLTTNPDYVAKEIWLAYHRKRNIVYVPFYWRWFMFFVKFIPEEIFKRLKL